MEIAQTIDDSLEEWYSGRGLSVPRWRTKRDPQWWVEYLKSLNLDPKNP